MYMKATFRHKVYARIPLWVRRHDFEIFTAFLCITAAIPLLAGQVDPASMEAQLPTEIVFIWALVLFAGPFLILTGLALSYREDIFLVAKIRYMRREALGLSFLGISSLLYAICILLADPSRGWVASMITIAFSLTCLTREMGVQEKIDELKGAAGVPPDDLT